MRKTAVSIGLFVLAMSGVAVARSYNGLYEQGAQSGATAPGLQVQFQGHSFNVVRMVMPETCTGTGAPAINDFSGFEQSQGQTLAGKVSRHGLFSGTFNQNSSGVTGSIKVTGRVFTTNLSLTGTLNYQYTPTTTSGAYMAGVTYTCVGQSTFLKVPNVALGGA